MSFVFKERASDVALVERVWYTENEQAGSFTSAASSQWEMVVSKYEGKTSLTLRGPETKASNAECPADVEFFG
ncbi:MAG: AraC family transcriptional regulator, partial [Anaerolineae bacterium]|nr:AraC family transcriptional regulator [Anaerolineae bacterium]